LGFSMTMNVGIFIGCTKDIGPRWHMRIEYRQGNLFMSQLAACIETIFIYLFVLWFSIFHLGFEDAAKSLAVFLVVMHFHRETSSSRKACKAREWTPATRCLFWDCGTRRNCSNFNFFRLKLFYFFFILICFVKNKF